MSYINKTLWYLIKSNPLSNWINLLIQTQMQNKTKLAKPLTSWVLPWSCGRVRGCLKVLSLILHLNGNKKPLLHWWQGCHNISFKKYWVSFSSDFMKQYTQEGAIGMTDTKKHRGQGMQWTNLHGSTKNMIQCLLAVEGQANN